MTFNFNVDGITPQDVSSGGGGGSNSGVGYPSNRYEDITPLASGEFYTAPADGYFYAYGLATATKQYIQLIRLTDSDVTAYSVINSSSYSGEQLMPLLPISAGGRISIRYNVSNFEHLRFIYAEGAE